MHYKLFIGLLSFKCSLIPQNFVMWLLQDQLVNLLVNDGGFATAVHAQQLHTAAAIAVALIRVCNFNLMYDTIETIESRHR